MDTAKLRNEIRQQVKSQILGTSQLTSGYSSHFLRRHGGLLQLREAYAAHGDAWLHAAIDDMLMEIDNILSRFRPKERVAC